MNLTYISLFVILGLSGWAYFYLSSQNNDQLLAKRHWIETIPNAISTLGVLGTFLGITVGLVGFDTQDLQTSIPQLLNGLKTAFFTSLAGMLGSLLLSKKVNNLYDEVTGGVSDINQAAASICQAVSNLQKHLHNKQIPRPSSII
jgi:membrane associated rhomboid family serine protease